MRMICNLCWHFDIIVILLALSLFVQTSSQLGNSRWKVEELPGFQGPLPFELETGYVGVGETDDDDKQVFYYFIKSEKDPQNDPLMLWLSGGPGCSSFTGLIFQIGPIAFSGDFNGSLPNLILRPQSWTKVCNIIFVDLPIGAGFSYAKNSTAERSDWKVVHHAHQFLRKWLVDHSEFISNEFYMGADSFSGITAPAIVQEISHGNAKGLQPRVNLQGYILGNPVTTLRERNYQIPFAHGMELISDELYQSLQRNCEGEYTDIDSRNELCLRDLNNFDECLSGLSPWHILEPCCKDDVPRHEAQWRRSLRQKFEATHFIMPDKCCEIRDEFISGHWANDESVHKSLHIREGTITNWKSCDTTRFVHQISNSFDIHVNLSVKGYRSLIYSGDHDGVVTSLSTQAWIKALNYSIVDDWRSWLVKGQIAGYTRTYANKMTFATVKGAGHIAGSYKPDECFAMFIRWITNVPL